MLRLLLLSTIQCFFLVITQIFLKLAVVQMGAFHFSVDFFKRLLVNWQFACSGVSVIIATILWMYILKHFDFSMAYPMISISYIFGMVASIVVFNESIPSTRWIGVILIMIGVIFVAKQ